MSDVVRLVEAMAPERQMVFFSLSIGFMMGKVGLGEDVRGLAFMAGRFEEIYQEARRQHAQGQVSAGDPNYLRIVACSHIAAAARLFVRRQSASAGDILAELSAAFEGAEEQLRQLAAEMALN